MKERYGENLILSPWMVVTACVIISLTFSLTGIWMLLFIPAIIFGIVSQRGLFDIALVGFPTVVGGVLSIALFDYAYKLEIASGIASAIGLPGGALIPLVFTALLLFVISGLGAAIGSYEGLRRLSSKEIRAVKPEDVKRLDRGHALLRYFIILFLSVSAIMHVSQLAIIGVSLPVMIVALFGVVYAMIAFLHFTMYHLAIPLSILAPALGAALGIYRFIFIQPNTFSVIDVSWDLILIIPLSLILFKKGGYSS